MRFITETRGGGDEWPKGTPGLGHPRLLVY